MNDALNTINAVSEAYSIPVKDILGKSRKARISEARIHCYVILRNAFGFTYENIGRLFNRGHSNILTLVKNHESKFNNLTLNGLKNPKLNISQRKILNHLYEAEIDLMKKRKAIRNLISFYEKIGE